MLPVVSTAETAAAIQGKWIRILHAGAWCRLPQCHRKDKRITDLTQLLHRRVHGEMSGGPALDLRLELVELQREPVPHGSGNHKPDPRVYGVQDIWHNGNGLPGRPRTVADTGTQRKGYVL